MAGLYELIKRNIAPYLIYVVVLLIVIFAIAAYYLYDEYKPKDSSVLDKIHQPSENVDEQTTKTPKETELLALSAPQIVGIILLIMLAIILDIWIYKVNGRSGPIIFTILAAGAGILYGFRTAFYEKQTPELWGKKYRNYALGPTIESGTTITVYFFTADWCPHCRNAKPSIDDFEREYNNKLIVGKKIQIVRVDCTDSEVAEVAKQINDLGVTSYPTVKIKDSNGNTFEFDAKITKENLVGFAESVAKN